MRTEKALHNALFLLDVSALGKAAVTVFIYARDHRQSTSGRLPAIIPTVLAALDPRLTRDQQSENLTGRGQEL